MPLDPDAVVQVRNERITVHDVYYSEVPHVVEAGVFADVLVRRGNGEPMSRRAVQEVWRWGCERRSIGIRT